MELSHHHGFLEQLLEENSRRECWATANFLPSSSSSTAANELFISNNAWNFNSNLDPETSSLPTQNPSSFTSHSSTFNYPFDHTFPFFDGLLSSPLIPTLHELHYYPSTAEDDAFGLLRTRSFEFDSCKVDIDQPTNQLIHTNAHQVLSSSNSVDTKKSNKCKRLQGQPSKNLMAERRRRKRLNDRLSMLRSIVPKISKMDRTSILGDTIDYMKELLDRINKLQEEEEDEEGINKANVLDGLKEIKPNEVQVRNSPKFRVERRETDTRIDICCSSKPGLLLSTVNTLEALGLEIQQCVISCFNEFSMQAACSEAVEQRAILTPEDIKQALFRTAGYGGRCM